MTDTLPTSMADYLAMLNKLEGLPLILNQPPTLSAPACIVTSGEGEKIGDHRLVQSIISYYQRTTKQFDNNVGAMWSGYFWEAKKDIHEALLRGNEAEVANILRHPEKNRLFWGFDAIALHTADNVEPHEVVIRSLNTNGDWQSLYARWVYDAFLTLAVLLGVRRAPDPEAGVAAYAGDILLFNLDVLVDEMADALGFDLQFPNPYTGELGLPSKRGVIGMRAIQSLYQAYRIREILGDKADVRVLEIGAGLGRTAYYAYQMGIRNYTILDIPMTNIAQAYFLGRTLGEGNVALENENSDSNQVKILPCYVLKDLDRDYDLILNADSLTEMDEQSRRDYWDYIRQHAHVFLSINHEYNSHTVRELSCSAPLEWARRLYPLRRGYIEETAVFPKQEKGFKKWMNIFCPKKIIH